MPGLCFHRPIAFLTMYLHVCYFSTCTLCCCLLGAIFVDISTLLCDENAFYGNYALKGGMSHTVTTKYQHLRERSFSEREVVSRKREREVFSREIEGERSFREGERGCF